MSRSSSSQLQVTHDFGGRQRPSSRPSRDGDRRQIEARRGALATRLGAGEPRPVPTPVPERRRRRTRSSAHVSLFFASHGGVGCTTLATSAAAMLARGGKTTAIVDLDLQFGSVRAALELEQRYPLSALAEEIEHLDRDQLLARLPRHSSGAYVLSQVGAIEGLDKLDHAAMRALLRRLRLCFDVLLIDGVRDFSDQAVAALDVAHSVLVVTTPDVPAMRGLAMRLEVFEQLGYAPSDLLLLLNRHHRRAPVPIDSVRDSLGVEPAFVVADDLSGVQRAVTTGQPLGEAAPRGVATRDLATLVDELYGVDVQPAPRGLFARLRGRR